MRVAALEGWRDFGNQPALANAVVAVDIERRKRRPIAERGEGDQERLRWSIVGRVLAMRHADKEKGRQGDKEKRTGRVAGRLAAELVRVPTDPAAERNSHQFRYGIVSNPSEQHLHQPP